MQLYNQTSHCVFRFPLHSHLTWKIYLLYINLKGLLGNFKNYCLFSNLLANQLCLEKMILILMMKLNLCVNILKTWEDHMTVSFKSMVVLISTYFIFFCNTAGTFRLKKPRQMKDPNKSSSDATLSAHECLDLLKHHLPHYASRKISQMMFVKWIDVTVVSHSVFISILHCRYMYRRCKFLEQLSDMKSDEISSEQCSTLARLMLQEVAAFINPQTQGPWSKSIPLQVIKHIIEGSSTKAKLRAINSSNRTKLGVWVIMQ